MSQSHPSKPVSEQKNNAATDTAQNNDQSIQKKVQRSAEMSRMVGKQQRDERANASSAAAQNQGQNESVIDRVPHRLHEKAPNGDQNDICDGEKQLFKDCRVITTGKLPS